LATEFRIHIPDSVFFILYYVEIQCVSIWSTVSMNCDPTVEAVGYVVGFESFNYF